MKALLYKEFKLAMHPVCYVFVILFPLMTLIPSYPLGIGFIYVLTCYPILFLGANKGQQSNDLLFSTLLPVRKKDIVKARIATVAILQFSFMAITSALFPLSLLISQATPGTTVPGIGHNGFVSLLGLAIIGYSLADLIYFPIYYKKGKSIVASTLFTILGFVFYIGIFTIGLPFVPGMEWYTGFLCESGLGYQFLFLGICLLLYVGIHYLIYRIASKELERVDF